MKIQPGGWEVKKRNCCFVLFAITNVINRSAMVNEMEQNGAPEEGEIYLFEIITITDEH